MKEAWLAALRLRTLTASIIPISLGAALSGLQGSFDYKLFLLTLFGGIVVQIGTNFMNTYGDYVSGVDTPESAPDIPGLVKGIISPRNMKMAAVAAFAMGGAAGLILTYLRGWPVFVCGVIGIAAGYCYTAGISPYKYKGLGTIVVFFMMGPLMVWPAYYIQSGIVSWLPLLVSLPIGLLVAAILHANDLRDFPHDQKAGIKTLALNLGFKKSVMLYYAMHVTAFLSLLGLIILGVLPWTAVLPIIMLPIVIKKLIDARGLLKGATSALIYIDGYTARFHFGFGFLLIVGIVLYPYVGH